ncbi:MAG: peptidylprolyl isomerase [Planctomycetaceae bacterium]|nr:peptidylprolyl isomerase [Planctomycetaceae bacterium]
MSLKKTLRNLLPHRRLQTRNRRTSLKTESLEVKALLAGNVLVSLSNGNASITGDASDNSIEIIASGNTIVVQGLNNTTVNGQSTAFVLSSTGLTFGGYVDARLGAGNDSVRVGSGLTFQRNVFINGQAGNDTLGVEGSSFSSQLRLIGESGTDGLALTSVTAKDVRLSGTGVVLFAVTNSTIAQTLEIDSDRGADDVVISGSTINGLTHIETRRGEDDIVLKNSTLNSLHIDAGAGNDIVYVDGTTVRGEAWMWMGRGNDSVQIQGSTNFQRRLRVIGGSGGDAVQVDSPAVVSSIRKSSSKGTDVVDSLVSTRITDSTTGAISRSQALASGVNATIGLAIAVDVLAETAGADATTATITRTGSTATALTVTLTSSETSVLTVPATVTIPVGSTSATFNLTVLDNTTTAGTKTVTVTAAATGLTSATDTIRITDNETAGLTLSTTATSVAETAGSGAVTYTLSRNTEDNSVALTVNLASSLPGRMTVPATVTIPAGAASTTFTASPVDTTLVDGDASVTVTATATGFSNGTSSITVTDNDTAALSLSAAPSTVAENAGTGAVTLTVSRNTSDNTQAITVTLTSSDTARLTVPATVEIPAGSASATFTASIVDNSVVESNQSITVTAALTGFTSGTTTVGVTENDSATLTLTAAQNTIAENAGTDSLQFEVTRNTADTSAALVVSLASTSTRVAFPATVTIPAGQSSVTFTTTPQDDAIYVGTTTFPLTAVANGFTNGQSSVSVTDDETQPDPGLSVALSQVSVVETAGSNASTVTVTRTNADTSQDLVVDLTLSDTGRLTLPATVTIPAGQTSASVSLSTINNESVEGDDLVTLTATAAGLTNGQTTLTVVDDDTAVLTLTPAATTVAEDAGTLSATVSMNRTSSTDVTVNLFYSNTRKVTGPASVVIPAGQTSVTFDLTIHDGATVDGSTIANVLAAASGAQTSVIALTITDVDDMPLSTDTSSNTTEQSNGTVITRDTTFRITGETAAGATITLDTNDDGIFGDATAVADSNGFYTVDVTLTHTPGNSSTPHLNPGFDVPGSNYIVVRAESGGQTTDAGVNVHLAVGTVVRFQSTQGTFDVELLDDDAPITVQNFVNYMETGAWQNLIVHRSETDFVIQSGGFTVSSNSVISSVAANAPITNEFNAANSNVYGTLSMALAGSDINSGTNNWFINVLDNSALDAGKYTVFGNVIGTGMTVVTQINQLTSHDLSTLYGSSALENVPLTSFNAGNVTLSGTIDITQGSTTMTGTGTKFTTELQAGDSLKIGNTVYFVATIVSDTELTVDVAPTVTAILLTGVKDVLPDAAEFVVFSDISEILHQI